MSKKSKLVAVFLALTMMILVTFAYFNFNHQLETYIVENSDSRIEEVVTPSVEAFEKQIEEQIKKVVMMSDFFSYSSDLGNQEHVELMAKAVESNQLLRCALSFPNGDFITHDHKVGNVVNEDFFITGMKNQIHISDPMPAVVDATKTVLLISAPIFKNNEVAGVLTYSYLVDKEKPFIDMTFLRGEGQLLIINSQGNLLLGTTDLFDTTNSLIENLRGLCSHKEHTADTCLKLGKEKAFFIISGGQGNILVHYNKLKYKDWYMMEVISEKSLLNAMSMVEGAQFNLRATILLLMALYAVIVGGMWYKDHTNYDRLTGMLTFENLKKRAERVMKKNPKGTFALVKLDIKGFKLINNIYNFETGDRVIISVAEALNKVLDKKTTAIARLGIDEFIFFIPYENKEVLAQQREKFMNLFRELMGETFTTIVEFPTGQYVVDLSEVQMMNVGLMYERANFAHGLAKLRGAENVIDYETSIEKEAVFQKKIEDRMEDALKNEEFKLYFQPKFNAQQEKICGVEALVRWEIEGVGIMYPIDFIPVFEKNGFIVRIDMYMFKKAVMKVKALMDQNIKPVPVSVNFSRYHLYNKNFVQNLCEIANKYHVPHHLLEVELTESVAFDNEKRMIELISELHAEDFKISLDDFGSGYSSIGLLKNLKVDTIKLDRSMFTNAVDESRGWIVVANVIALAKELSCSQVAEGIEERDQVDKLKELGCDMIQGFYFSKPVAADEIDYSSAIYDEDWK